MKIRLVLLLSLQVGTLSLTTMVVLQGGKRNLQPLSGTIKRFFSSDKNVILSGRTRNARISQSINLSLSSCNSSNHKLKYPFQRKKSKSNGRFVPQLCRNLSCKAGNGHEQMSETIDSEDAQFLDKVKSVLFGEILSRISSTSLLNSDPFIILLAVSGGCDSIALFHSVLHFLSDETLFKGFKVHVVHFDHCQRGQESDEDRSFVEKKCEENNIPFHCFVWDTDGMSKGRFSQEVARNWRREESLKLICDLSSSGGAVLTAHHRDDAEETILLKILRGVHLTNISGMESLQQVSEGYDVDARQLFFGKPFLHVRKEEVCQFLDSQNITWREDASNATDKYKRNKVRHQLIPLLQDLVGGEKVLEVSSVLFLIRSE